MGLGTVIERMPGLILILFAVMLVIACFFMRNTQEKLENFTLSNRRMLVVVILLLWSILSLSEISQFLYVNF